VTAQQSCDPNRVSCWCESFVRSSWEQQHDYGDRVIDGHNDLPWAMRKLCDYDFDLVDLSASVPSLHTDIERLHAGGVTGQFWSVYVPSTLPGPEAVAATVEQIDFVYRLVERYPRTFALAKTAEEVVRARSSGRIASLIGMEGGHSINESLGVLRMMAELGVRYMTLTHNDNVSWADSATDVCVLGGLSAFGHEVVREMNRLGMIVDLSHVSADVMRQAIATSGAPVMFSHSSARSVCDVARNVPDDVLELLAINQGICMVTFVPDFVSPALAAWFHDCEERIIESGGNPRDLEQVEAMVRRRTVLDPPPVATISDVVAHFEHVRAVAGIDHVGIGGDYDGSTLMPKGLDDVSGYPQLFSALRAAKWSEEEIDQLSVGNVLRVLRENEDVGVK
jgi:membrane dipeptidase